MSQKIKIILIVTCLIGLFAAIPIYIFAYNPPRVLEVDFLNVGQGDAILIKTPFGQNVLIDGGPDSSVIAEINKNLSFWDKKIDLVLLTHPHDDHAMGMIDVIRRYDVKTILYSGAISKDVGYVELIDLIKEKEILPKIIDHSQSIKLGNGCALNILYPFGSLAGKNYENLNNSSIVSMLDCEQIKVLFTGDAELELENELIKSGIDLKADVLKVGHHGSDTSSGENFLHAIKPEWAVIQVGKDNKFGHPNLRILKRLERIGAKVFRTDEDGMIKIIIDEGKIFIPE